MVAATDSEDSSLQVGPPRQAASPQPTRPSPVSRRTKTKFIISRVVKDILCGRSTGMSAWITRTSAIFMDPHYPCCERSRQARSRPSRCRSTRRLFALAAECEIQGKGSADALRSREAFYVGEEVFTE